MNFFKKDKHKPLTEKQLVKACQKGKKKHQFTLVERYSSMLMSICLRYAPDEAIAKDILQESFIRIFTHIDTYKFTGSFEGWMKKITTRCALQWLSKNYVKREVLVDQIQEDEVIEPEVYGNLDEKEIIRLIQELPDGYRSVFNLSVVEGYNHKEIAVLLDISESTSRSQLVRARKMLQKKLNTLNTKNYRSA